MQRAGPEPSEAAELTDAENIGGLIMAMLSVPVHDDWVSASWDGLLVQCMWDLMLPDVRSEDIHAALVKHSITSRLDLIRIGNARFTKLDPKPSGDAALDKMVAAASFALAAKRLPPWLEAMNDVCQTYWADHPLVEDDPPDRERDREVAFYCELAAAAQDDIFGLNADAVNAALHAIGSDNFGDLFLDAIKPVREMVP